MASEICACGKPADSLMDGLCQLCWEAQCDRSWWEMMRRLDEAMGPVMEGATK